MTGTQENGGKLKRMNMTIEWTGECEQEGCLTAAKGVERDEHRSFRSWELRKTAEFSAGKKTAGVTLG